jgi:hypothetical protein
MFREDRENHCYGEVDAAEYFPELVGPPSIILWMDIHHCKTGARYEVWAHLEQDIPVSAFPFKYGYLK